MTIVGIARLGVDDIPIVRGPDQYVTEWPSVLTRRPDGQSRGPWAQLSESYGPIFRRRFPPDLGDAFGQWAVYVIGPDANRAVFDTNRHLLSHEFGWRPYIAPLFKKGLLDSDDPEHARDRKMMNPAFASRHMERYLAIMNRVVSSRIADWVGRKSVDLYEEARKITFDIAAEALVGLETGREADHLRELFYDLLKGGFDQPGLTENMWIEQFSPARHKLDELLLRTIGQRRKEPTDDILSWLVLARDEQGRPFSEGELLGQAHILLSAGHETTTTLAAWTLYLLATNPGYLDRATQEIDRSLLASDGKVTTDVLRGTRLLGYAITEAGRLRAPVCILPRRVTGDFDFSGYRVPAGTYLFLCASGCHFLPHVFADPERYDPDRFAPPREEDKRTPYALATFGGGPRICIGINFAQIEIKVLASTVFSRYSLFPVDGNVPQHVYYGINAHVPGGMFVSVASRTG